ncbi:MAG: septal ring lytic transglycosylase RlpA family protein [Burkholderiales bacterium]
MTKAKAAQLVTHALLARLPNLADAPSFLIPCIAALVLGATLSGCGSAPVRQSARGAERPQAAKAPDSVARSRGGGYYLDDGPGEAPPANLDSIPEPVPQFESLHRGAMRPYVVMGQTYTPMTELAPYKARGIASWYGRRYHGKQTSTGEVYDMYGMTAAHPLLPLPSYVRVTNIATGKSVIVRVNDRGPFIDSRLIDLSYTAAHRLGVLAGGSAMVEVEAVIPEAVPDTLIGTARRQTRLADSAAAVAAGVTAPANVSVAKPDPVDVDPIVAIAAAAREGSASPAPVMDSQASQQQPVPISSSRAGLTDSTGVYLQLAAFVSRDNAESYLARTRMQVEWLAQLLHLFPRDGMYRVHVGPYASTIEARQAAKRIGAALGIKPVIVNR